MIAEFHFGSPVLGEALSETGASAIVESLDTIEDGRLRAMVWVYSVGEALDRFETLLEDDERVGSTRHLASVNGGHLYRIVFRRDTNEVRAYRAAVDRDAAILDAESSGDGWWFRTRFPDRDAFATWLETIEDDVQVEIHALYDQESQDVGADRYGLTGPQREALLTAVSSGYFEVPRKASLADVAEDLNVSSQAASERLRRGVKTVLVEALRSDLEVADEG